MDTNERPKPECIEGDCPTTVEWQARYAIDTLNKVDLIHGMRALATMRMWDLSVEELRSMLHAAIDNGEFKNFEVLNALRGGA